MKTLKLLIVFCLLTGFSFVKLNAQVDQIFEKKSPYHATSPCTGEAISGTINWHFVRVYDQDSNLKIIKVSMHGEAVGEISGLDYRVNCNANILTNVFKENGADVYRDVDELKWQCNDGTSFTWHFMRKIVWDPDGETQLSFDRSDLTCD